MALNPANYFIVTASYSVSLQLSTPSAKALVFILFPFTSPLFLISMHAASLHISTTPPAYTTEFVSFITLFPFTCSCIVLCDTF